MELFISVNNVITKVARSNLADPNTSLAIPIKIQWHKIGDLSDYLKQPIQEIGRKVFKHFTDIPVEEVEVVSTWTNPADAVKTVARWLFSHGQKHSDAALDFSKLFPGYHADLVIYTVGNHQYMVVKDFAGYYIYAWPNPKKLT